MDTDKSYINADPDVTHPVQGSVQPDATHPVQGSVRPDATHTVQGNVQPDVTHPVQGSVRPEGERAVRDGILPEATGHEIRILHLYHDLMNLYGAWGNTAILMRAIEAHGHTAVIDRKSVGDDVDFNLYSFIHIGCGTERSLRACMRDITRHRDAFVARIEAGALVLATGNSHELFGRAVTDPDGSRYKTIGLLGFETFQKNSRVTGDCICSASFLDGELIGFINRAGHGQEGEIDRPFTMTMGPGANDVSHTEGIRYKNLLGTYMTGPILIRNPHLLEYYVSLICPGNCARDGDDLLFSAQERAYRLALRELSARLPARTT